MPLAEMITLHVLSAFTSFDSSLCDRCFQSVKGDRIDPLPDQRNRFIVIVFHAVLPKYRRGLDCKRTIDIYWKIPVALHKPIRFDLTDKI